MSDRPIHVSVVIPARDEEELLPQCLKSILIAFTKLPKDVSFDLVVAVDSSTDRTWDIAVEHLAHFGSVVRTDAGVVGQTRAIASRRALERYSGPLHQCWLANTDADCVVPPDWLNLQLALAAGGVDVIAGTVDVVDFKEHAPAAEERFRRMYPIAANGYHSHVHGANLGFRASAYLQSGGWGNLETGEDHDLWKRLSAVFARKLSVNETRIVTSGRRIGRAPRGFAEALAAINESVA